MERVQKTPDGTSEVALGEMRWLAMPLSFEIYSGMVVGWSAAARKVRGWRLVFSEWSGKDYLRHVRRGQKGWRLNCFFLTGVQRDIQRLPDRPVSLRADV